MVGGCHLISSSETKPCRSPNFNYVICTPVWGIGKRGGQECAEYRGKQSALPERIQELFIHWQTICWSTSSLVCATLTMTHYVLYKRLDRITPWRQATFQKNRIPPLFAWYSSLQYVTVFIFQIPLYTASTLIFQFHFLLFSRFLK